VTTTSRSVSPVRRVRHVLRSRVSEHPGLYLPFARYKYPGPSPEVISKETELVIDGYTRCATTFAVYALQLSQRRPVRLAHHLHAPAQLIEAARNEVPALVLIREPRGAILSQLIREPDVAMPDALVAYTRFYSCLLPYRDRFVVGDFPEVTVDFGAVVRRLNAKFGTSFVEFVPTEANIRQCFELIKQRPTLSKTLLGFESGVVTFDELRECAAGEPQTLHDAEEAWVPSAERQRAKDALQAQWLRPELARARDAAQDIYQTFLAG
jgi:hypothetical protein